MRPGLARQLRSLRWGLVLPLMALAACGNQIDPQPVTASGSTLCLADYERCVNPILDTAINGRTGTATCSAGGCHSQNTGSGGSFKIYPGATAGSPEIRSNFFSARSFANLDDPASSRLLQKPTAGRSASVGGHAGGDIFPDTSDPCHVAIRQWISNRVDSEDAAVCGSCVAVDISRCGF